MATPDHPRRAADPPPGRRLGARRVPAPRRLPAPPGHRRAARLRALGARVRDAERRGRRPGYYVFRQIIYVASGRRPARGGGRHRPARVPAGPLAALRALARPPAGGASSSPTRCAARSAGSRSASSTSSRRSSARSPDHRAGGVRRRARQRLGEWRTTLGVIGLCALMVLVFKEPDFGTTLIYAAIVIGALFFGGTPWRHLAVLAVAAGLVAGALLWFLPSAGLDVLEPYQRERSSASSIRTSTRADRRTTSTSRSRPSARAASTVAARRTPRRRSSTTSRALDRLHLLVARGAARLHRGLDPAPALRGHHLARHEDRLGGEGPLLGDPRRGRSSSPS